MPVRFKDTAEYHQRFIPQVTQKLQTNSSKVSDLSSGNQPLVSILKTSVLPTEPDNNHSDDYVLLGSQSKFAPSIRYRLRPTAVHPITPPIPPPPPPPPYSPPLHPSHQQYTNASSASLHRKEDVRVRGQSSSQGHDDVKGSVLIGQGINSRRSQSCQSNADDLEESVGDRKTKRRLIPRKEAVEEESVLLRGIARNEENVKGEGHRLGQTYNVTRGSQPHSDSVRLSSKKQQKQEQTMELHHHHHHHQAISSTDDRLRLNQATQTKDGLHHQRGMEEESNEERQRRRRTMKRIGTIEDKGQENKENRHSHSADDQPISRQDDSYHRNRNNNSYLTANQKTAPSYDGERRKEKSGGERGPSGERHRGRETEEGGHRGRETEPQSSLGARAKNHHHDDDRIKHNAEEMKPKKSVGGIHQTTSASSSASALPPPPLPYPLRHHPSQQHLHLETKRLSSRVTESKSAYDSRRNIWRSSGDGMVPGRRRTVGHGKTSVEMEQRRLLGKKRSRGQHPVTSADRSSSIHDSTSQDKRSSGIEEDKRTRAQSQMPPNNVTSTDGGGHHRHGSKDLPPFSGSSKAESVSHASVTKKDEMTQTMNLRMSDGPTMTLMSKREDDFHHQQPSKSLTVGHLKSDPSEYQTQFQWRQRPTPTETFIQQQQPTSASERHPHRSASVISLSHPDFRTLFASPSTNNDEDTEYRFQYRPISARNDRSNNNRNFAPQQNQMRRGQSLRDLSTGERNEETKEGTTSVIVRHEDKPRKYRSEYMRNFQPPWNYQYEDGTWKEMEKGKRRNDNSQVSAADVVDMESSSLLLRSSSSASSWYEEVLQLRRHADEYRKRANGTHFSREQLEQLYARNVDSRGDATAFNHSNSAPSQNDSRMSSRGRNDESSVALSDGRRTEDETMRRRRSGRRIKDGGRGERTTDGGGGGSAGGRPLRHHFDRTGQRHPRRGEQPVSSADSSADDDSELSDRTEDDHLTSLQHHHDSLIHNQSRFQDNGGESEEEEEEQRRRPFDLRLIKQRRTRGDQQQQQRNDDDDGQRGRRSTSTTEVRRRDDDGGPTKKTTAQTDSVRKEDKSVQIDLEGGTAFQSNHRKILSSSSLASQVLERARNRKDKFWSK